MKIQINKSEKGFTLRSILLLFVVFLVANLQLSIAQNDSVITVKEVSLAEIANLAQQNNLGLKMFQKDNDIALENIKNAKMAKAPYINAGAYYNYIGNPVLYSGFYQYDTTINYFHQQTGWSIAAGIPVTVGGRIKNQIQQSEIVSRVQKEMLLMSEKQLNLSMITQFYSLYKLYRDIEINETNIKNVKINIKQLESKVANGQNIISDLSRTRLQLSNFEITVFKLWNDIDLLSNYICIQAGLPTNIRLLPKNVSLKIPDDVFTYAQCLVDAFANRNELKQSLLQRQYSEISLKQTKSFYLPTTSVNAFYNSAFPVPGTFPPKANTLSYWAVGIGINYELSSLYNLKHRIKSDEIQVEKEDTNIQQIKNSIEQEVKSAFIHFIESKKNIISYQKNVELAELNYRIVKSKYDNEFALIIDMIDAELQVNDSKLSLNKAIIESINQYYALLYAMGKLK